MQAGVQTKIPTASIVSPDMKISFHHKPNNRSTRLCSRATVNATASMKATNGVDASANHRKVGGSRGSEAYPVEDATNASMALNSLQTADGGQVTAKTNQSMVCEDTEAVALN